MKIEIFTSGFCIDNGKPTQRGACAARLSYADEHGRKAVRVISEPIGDSTGPQCDLKAAMVGLMSVRSDLRKCDIDLFTSTYVAQLTERDGDNFKLVPKKNAELVKRLREKVILFNNLVIKVGTKEQLQQITSIAKTVAETAIGDDSETITS